MTYYRPKDLDEALTLLERHPDFLLLCGSTDAVLQLEHRPETGGIIDLHALEGLRAIEKNGDVVRIGALVTVNDLLHSDEVQRHLPLLAACAEHFGSHQIRNLATVGGNIANASPAADLVAVLVALGASVTLGSCSGERTLPLEELFCGYKCTKLSHEIILGVTVPLEEHQWYYRKAGARERLNITKVSIAVVKTGSAYRISGASLGPNAVRFRTLEALLEGGDARDDAIKVALEKDTDPTGGHRSTRAYRHRVAFNMLKEALARLEAP
jgi:CO/xanthine dehydrogenase FAD-binding subunit